MPTTKIDEKYEEILNGPKGFYCKQFKTRMLKKSCILRQQRAYRILLRKKGPHQYTPSSEMDLTWCLDCEQGKEIQKELSGGKIENEKEDTQEMPKVTDKPKCRECGEADVSKLVKNPRLKNGVENWCKECRARYMRERNKDKKPEPKQEESHTEDHVEINDNVSLFLNLSPWPEIMEYLPDAARLHVRDVEHQAVAYIVEGLKRDGFGEKKAAA